MNRFAKVVAVVGVSLGLVASAEAQTKLRPYQFGQGTMAAWMLGAGKPASGDSNQYGFYMQKLTTSATPPTAGAILSPIPSGLTTSNLTMSFDIPGAPGQPFDGIHNGYCQGASPGFIITTALGDCYMTCNQGSLTRKTQDPVTGWWTIGFGPPYSDYCGTSNVTPNAPVTGIEISWVDGIDAGAGNGIIDNITIRKGTSTPIVIKNP